MRKSPSSRTRPRTRALLASLAVLCVLGGYLAGPAGALASPDAGTHGRSLGLGQPAARLPRAPGRAPRPQQEATPSAPPGTLLDLEQQMNAAWNAQNWPEVLRLIRLIMQIDPNYDDIRTKQYLAHANYGYQLLNQGRCAESLHEFRTAHDLDPNGEEARIGLDLVARYCATPPPPTPTLTPIPSVVWTPIAPPATPTLSPQTLTAPITYTVRAGDTLYGLAQRYGTSVQSIMQANGLMSYLIRAGEVIWIPASGSPPPGPLVHIVQPGDTLYAIARLYNTTVWAIMAANRLRGYGLYAYQALYIPSVRQPGPAIHLVQPGETLYTIARQHQTTVPLLMLANGLRSYELAVYQRLVIPPPGWAGWPPLGGQPHGPHPPQSPRTHVVQRGETLYGIAARHGVSVAALKAANRLVGSTITVGMALRIP